MDLLTSTLRQGRPLEQSLVEISNSRDSSPGVRFHLVAAYLEKGLRLGEALEKAQAEQEKAKAVAAKIERQKKIDAAVASGEVSVSISPGAHH